MRIALMVPGFSADQDDWCIPALLNLVRRLARDHDVHVFATRYPHRRDVYDVYGATVHAMAGAQARYLAQVPHLARCAAAAATANRPRRFDLIHGLWAGECGLLAVLLGRWLGIPAVVSVMGGELVNLPGINYGGRRTAFSRASVAASLRLATRVTVGSKALAESLGRPCHVLPLGADTDMFTPQGPRAALTDGINVVCAASLTAVKNHDLLLDAFAAATAQDPALHLHVLGEGPLRKPLEDRARARDLGEHVTFHGHLAHDQLARYFRAADFCVLASRHEAQAMAAVEAAACGTPTVGAAVGCLPELVPADLLSPPGDLDGLTQAILRLAEDPSLRQSAGAKALNAVAERFTLETCVSNLVALYKSL